MNEERLNNLEMKFLYQEEFLQELNKVIIEQQKVIDRLEKEVIDLKRNVNPHPNLDVNQKPPHY